jgi:UDPglucose--hexose-1-phosphate uridylyltransferase
MSAADMPHRRRNALTREWIVVSPHRAKRPWLGAQEKTAQPPAVTRDPKCYLCPGGTRAGDPPRENPEYEGTFVFPNDFAALLTPEETAENLLQAMLAPQAPFSAVGSAAAGFSAEIDGGGAGGERVAELRRRLLVSQELHGVCRVGCFSPRHDLTLAAMDTAGVRRVVDMWVDEYARAAAQDFVGHVQIFENKGEMMGCSNPHPHCQLWATSAVPQEPMKELSASAEYQREHGGVGVAGGEGGDRCCLMCDYLAVETADRTRIVFENDSFVTVVPYWALWPFETLVIARSHVATLGALSNTQLDDFAEAVRTMACKYDNMFEVAFPYSMGIHQSPTARGLADVAAHLGLPSADAAGALPHLHVHFYPPLLRSATVRKFMVGFEMLAEPQRDITAEISAQRLRDLDGVVHYSHGVPEHR